MQVGNAQTITMATNVYIGLGVSSDSNTSLATATIDNVSVNSITLPAPVITSVSATTGSVGSQVTINGANFGTAQGSSVVLLNGSGVTVNSWSTSVITITIPAGATSGPLVVSVAPSMISSSNPVQFDITSQPLLSPWLDRDIGTVGIPGNATYSEWDIHNQMLLGYPLEILQTRCISSIKGVVRRRDDCSAGCERDGTVIQCPGRCDDSGNAGHEFNERFCANFSNTSAFYRSRRAAEEARVRHLARVRLFRTG